MNMMVSREEVHIVSQAMTSTATLNRSAAGLIYTFSAYAATDVKALTC